MEFADVLVVGLGAAGAATLLQLVRRGVRAIGIDRFSPPHDQGSTHGETRITRLAIGEGEAYTPLVMRSHAIWRAIEAETGATLLTQNGGLVIESARGGQPLHARPDFLKRTIACAVRYGIDHEVLTAADISRRFPQFALEGDEQGYFEASAGFVRPEACVAAQLDLAARNGAVIRTKEAVLDIGRTDGGVLVRTDKTTYSGGHAVASVGPWIHGFIPPDVGRLFSVYRQVLVWFALRADATDHAPPAMPVFIWGISNGGSMYGFPAVDGPRGGVKVATEQFTETSNPDTARVDVDPAEPRALYADFIAERLPGLSDRCVKTVRCLYTTTPDGDFVVDWHPENDRLLLVSPCSGHGFKHSAGLGEALAELLTTGTSGIDLAPFSLKRFALATS